MDLRGKKIVITGGARRVGRELVRTFAAKGARIAIHYRNSETEAHNLLEEIGGTAAGHELYECDLADLDRLEAVVPDMMADASVLINNASVYIQQTLTEEGRADMISQLTTNFLAPVLLMQAFARFGQRPGAVVNLLDQAICRPDERSFSYGLSKKALAQTLLTSMTL